MGTLTANFARCGAALTLLVAAPAAAGPPAVEESIGRWRPYVEEASRRFGVPAAWIERVMIAESGGRTVMGGRPTTSRAGAMGLMQLMPGTWAEMRRRLGLGPDPHAPRDNILAGTYYLRLMHDRFGYPGLFGAYNAGPARYAAYAGGRQRLPAETRTYLAKVTGAVPVTIAGPVPVPLPTPPVPPTRPSPAKPSDPGGGADPAGSGSDRSLFFIRR